MIVSMYDIVTAIGQFVFWFILLAPLGQVVSELIDRRRFGGVEREQRNQMGEPLITSS
jgi:hypothetical protein